MKLKTLLTDAMRKTFDSDYVNADFRNIKVSIEFPVDRADYPSVWVGFDPEGQLESVGVGHQEVDAATDESNVRRSTRWYFQGHATFTVVAMSSLERDRLHDEIVRVMAFGTEQPQTNEFRSAIEDNEFLAVNIDFDQIATLALTQSPGTPWETEEMVYEATLSMECFGEFVSDGFTQTLARLSEIVTMPYASGEPDPAPVPTGSTEVGEGWM